MLPLAEHRYHEQHGRDYQGLRQQHSEGGTAGRCSEPAKFDSVGTMIAGDDSARAQPMTSRAARVRRRLEFGNVCHAWF